MFVYDGLKFEYIIFKFSPDAHILIHVPFQKQTKIQMIFL